MHLFIYVCRSVLSVLITTKLSFAGLSISTRQQNLITRVLRWLLLKLHVEAVQWPSLKRSVASMKDATTSSYIPHNQNLHNLHSCILLLVLKNMPTSAKSLLAKASFLINTIHIQYGFFSYTKLRYDWSLYCVLFDSWKCHGFYSATSRIFWWSNW